MILKSVRFERKIVRFLKKSIAVLRELIYSIKMKPIISIKNLNKTFGHQKVVDDFSIDVYEGDVFAFLGSNGSGKTTTFRCLLGIYAPTSGEVSILDKKYDSSLSCKIGYLPEERGVYTKSKVIDVFNYFAELREIKKEKRKKIIDEYLDRVGLAEHKDKKVSQLSSGMQQKVQIGITIIHRPKILILDEPFKGLDPLNRQLFLDIFEEMRDEGTIILYSTHVVDEVQRLANRLVMIKEGKRVLYGTINEIRNQFGSKNIIINFEGRLPSNNDLYVMRKEHNMAELTPKDGVDPNDILKYLIKENVQLSEFRIDRPSLNDIFIKVAKHK